MTNKTETKMPDEVWKEIPGFDGYKISNHGRVMSGDKLMKPSLTRKGYRRLGLYKNKKAYSRSVHSLVLEAFVGPRPDGYICAHNDGNKTNNHLYNLRYATHADNERDKKLHGTCGYGEKNSFAKLTQEQANIIRQNYRNIPHGQRTGWIKQFGVCRSTARAICSGQVYRDTITAIDKFLEETK